jgi:hypothetical protein
MAKGRSHDLPTTAQEIRRLLLHGWTHLACPISKCPLTTQLLFCAARRRRRARSLEQIRNEWHARRKHNCERVVAKEMPSPVRCLAPTGLITSNRSREIAPSWRAWHNRQLPAGANVALPPQPPPPPALDRSSRAWLTLLAVSFAAVVLAFILFAVSERSPHFVAPSGASIFYALAGIGVGVLGLLGCLMAMIQIRRHGGRPRP